MIVCCGDKCIYILCTEVNIASLANARSCGVNSAVVQDVNSYRVSHLIHAPLSSLYPLRSSGNAVVPPDHAHHTCLKKERMCASL